MELVGVGWFLRHLYTYFCIFSIYLRDFFFSFNIQPSNVHTTHRELCASFNTIQSFLYFNASAEAATCRAFLDTTLWIPRPRGVGRLKQTHRARPASKLGFYSIGSIFYWNIFKRISTFYTSTMGYQTLALAVRCRVCVLSTLIHATLDWQLNTYNLANEKYTSVDFFQWAFSHALNRGLRRTWA